jgi:hypothetical protein
MSVPSTKLTIARRLAYLIGIAAPLLDTIRRWDTWQEFPPALLDDYLIGALLVAGAWATRGQPSPRGRALLAAGWGFTVSMGYTSTALQWVAMQRGDVDPAPISSPAVFTLKLVGSLLAVGALVLTLADAPGTADGAAAATGKPPARID